MPTIHRILALVLAGAAVAALWFSAHVAAPAASAAEPRPQEIDRLRVATKPLDPFVIYRPDGTLDGFSIELWDAVAQDLDLQYDWVRMDTVQQILDGVRTGAADVSVAGISLTPDREAVIDFSHPYFDAGLQIITSAQPTLRAVDLFRTVFTPGLARVVGAGLLTLLIMAHIIWLVERRRNPEMPSAYLAGVWEGLWWALIAVAQFSYGDGDKPKDPARRLFAMALIAVGIVLIAQFTAAITASLTVQQLTGAIRGPSDLPGKTIATVSGSTAARYLESENVRYRGVEKIEEAYQLLESGAIEAVVYDAPVLRYYVATEGKGSARLTGGIFRKEQYGIALPTGSALREEINNSLLRLEQNGEFQRIYDKWFGAEP
jgi:ABC-type amino acid transport substrate-binding protein